MPESKTPIGVSVVVTCTDSRTGADWLPITARGGVEPESHQMSQPQIDVTKLVLRGLRALDDTRRGLEKGWQRLTGSNTPTEPPLDRRRPPGIW